MPRTPRSTAGASSYREDHAEQARKLCLLLGATDEELARFFEVPVAVLRGWLADIPAFAAAVRAGRDLADGEVADRLYRRALGFSHDAVRIFADREVPYVEHYPPDTAACIFWLKSRRPAKWRDRPERDASVDTADLLAELDAAGERAKNARRR
ncbi:MAG: helix-turn-helix domain-containing protein [Proteobacteria bacterium]|nr:helix-turn-helix domain-containing protein [Pseudomonadota bacterium]